MRKAPAKAPIPGFDKSDIITATPEGTQRLYSKAADYYSQSLFGVITGHSEGMPCTVVESADGGFYIYDPFAGLDSKSWLRADIDGDKMTIKLPQAIYADTDTDGTEYVYAAQLCFYEATDPQLGEGLYYPLEGEQQIVFEKKGDTWVMNTEEKNDHPLVMGLVATDDGSWCVYSDWNMAFTPFDTEPLTPPASLETSEWVLSFLDQEEKKYLGGIPVSIGIDGNDIYMKGFSSAYHDSWIKGTIDNGKATFLSEQYLGADEMDNAFAYFYGATEEDAYLEDWDMWYIQTILADNIVFDIDPSTGRYSSDGSIVINRGKGELNTIENLSHPRIQLQGTLTDFTPANPVVGFYNEPGDYAGSVYFSFPNLNTEGQILDTDKLYYRVLIDGETYTFYSDEYPGIEDGTEAIPFHFSNQNNIGVYGTANITHFFYFSVTGYDRLDIQTFYLDGENEYASALVNVVDYAGVASIADGKEAVATEWYDLTGRRTLNPDKGIYIKRTLFSDGSASAIKTAVR